MEPMTEEEIAEAQQIAKDADMFRFYQRRTDEAYKVFIETQNEAAKAYNAAVEPYVKEMLAKTRSARGKFVADVVAAKKQYLAIVAFADKKMRVRAGTWVDAEEIVDVKEAATIYEDEIDAELENRAV